ncbi:MAG: hypothetical protein QOK04_2826, partial [Solirubrobacteraceae bacterium]|nr:hypothetical protein [Solirubrobacteraceae bacterium]
MSHAQAFHTSCRDGLGGTSGFQISAATPSLDRDQLAAMSSAHARYEPAPDAPYEPTLEQMREFPVALRMSRVQGVGPLVSRTEYVGREYRGRNGAPDEGRFGNYFCHMVVGNSEGDPFDGLMAVELWDAPHWTTTDATDTTLEALGPLSPGQADLATVLAAVTAAPEGLGVALVDAALTAIEGGATLLIVDPVAARAVTWIAWIAYSLPTHVAHTLTFSTYEGRPQDILDLHVVATLPACDNGATMNSRVTRVDVTEAPQLTGTPSLYARAVAALATQGPEALASAVRMVRVDGAASQGASLAIIGKLTELVTDDDLPAVLEQILAMVRGGRTADAAEAAASLTASEPGDRAAIGLWAQLYAEARRSTSGDAARDLATIALGRLVEHLDHLPDPFPALPADTHAAPGVAGIGAWLRATEAAQGTDASGRLVLQGVQLRLIGLNVPVDNRVGAVIAADLERPA